MDGILESVKLVVADYAMRVIGVLIFLVVAFWAAKWLKGLVERTMRKRGTDETIGRFAGGMTRWLVILLAIIAALGIFGVETTSFAAVIGASSLAIGLAFQGSLSNVAAGVMLLIFRPFKVGDFVSVSGESGVVDELSLFTTTLDTPDNRRIIVPNSKVFGAVIQNVTFHDTRRVDVAVGVDYGAPIDKTREVLMKAIATVDGCLDDPAAVAVLANLGDSAVDWVVRVWCKTEDYWGVKEATTRAVKMALDDAGIGIPFPQMDVHLDKSA